ncbi:signal peptidase I [Gudongella oleilytica]|uniref:signal peptidase I n=1 Tax=Gudongella oleilytica TaxID=1582259 RepID=UPI002A35859E|nr:signal peptidase I [Gudongella oleilytica]
MIYLKERKGKGSEMADWLISLAVAMFVALFIVSNIATVTQVKEQSMEPTFQENDRVFVYKLGYIFSGPERGDVVILNKNPIKSGIFVNMINELEEIRNSINYRLGRPAEKNILIKRVIGIPGDRILIADGKVYLNGEALSEDYVNGETYTVAMGMEEEVIPEGKVFVMGDNRGNSLDSRNLGFISFSQLKGKVVYRFFPIDKAGAVQ